MKLTTHFTNYTPKGKLKYFPLEVIAKMLERQVEQGNKESLEVFENERDANKKMGGFDWRSTVEDNDFWTEVIFNRNFATFFQLYPKNSIEDKVKALRDRMVEHRDFIKRFAEDCNRLGDSDAWAMGTVKKDQFDIFIQALNEILKP